MPTPSPRRSPGWLRPPGLLVDVAGGTGSVAAALADAGRDVLVVDGSDGMLRHAVRRLPGRVARADARRLPLADASVAVVTTIWLLHLLPVADADLVLAEAARVLSRDGVLVTTVDKDLAHRADRRTGADAADRVAGRCPLLGRRGGTRPGSAGASRHSARCRRELVPEPRGRRGQGVALTTPPRSASKVLVTGRVETRPAGGRAAREPRRARGVETR